MSWLGLTLVAGIFGQVVFKEITQSIVELKSCDHFDNFPDDGQRIAGKDRTRAPPNSWPWIVRLQFFQPGSGAPFLCGGTVIADDLILTGKLFDIDSNINYLLSCTLLRQGEIIRFDNNSDVW